MTSINLKPNKPETYDGTRDFVNVSTWLYKVEQFLSLTQLSAPTTIITDHNRIAFASSYLSGNAAIWWFHLVSSATTPTTWESFKAALMNEFIPRDHDRRARDKLRTLKQTTSVEKYLAEYRNITLMIGDMNDGEKVDRFVDGLKYQVRVEVLKTNCGTFEDCARVALNVDSALWRARRTNPVGNYAHSPATTSGPTPMEIGNVSSGKTTRREQQHVNVKRKGACYRCHVEGCRPWKCGRNPKVNNVDVIATNEDDSGASETLSDSGNE